MGRDAKVDRLLDDIHRVIDENPDAWGNVVVAALSLALGTAVAGREGLEPRMDTVEALAVEALSAAMARAILVPRAG